MLFALDGGAHHVECSGEGGGAEELAGFEGCGGVVDYAAVDGKTSVGDEDIDIRWDSVFCRICL